MVHTQSSTLLTRALCSPSYVVKTIFRDSSVLVFTQTGFNVMFGHQVAKLYRGICAEVIRHLCPNGNPSEINDLVYTIPYSRKICQEFYLAKWPPSGQK